MDFSLSVSQLVITSSTTVIATENTEKEINLTTNESGASFAITGGADKDKFSLSGATLVFEATDFEAAAASMVESVPKLVVAAVFSAMLRLFMKVMSVGDSSLRSVKVTTNT
jgi:hypothetical protein